MILNLERMVNKAGRWLRRERKSDRRRAFRRKFPLPGDVEAAIERIHLETPHRAGGGCPPRKQRILARLIVERGLKRAVEIGVFAGGSLFPQAVAMRHTGGQVTGIDPWSEAEAEQKDNLDRILPALGEGWAKLVEWDGLYREVEERVERYGLSRHCILLRMTSQKASSLIEGPLDLLHIDGNHDYVRCADDLARWLPKVCSGGLLVLDDAAWDTIHPQYLELKERMRVVYEEPIQGSLRPEWAVLEKR
jgi:predicted O-methyltransferase YrrM